MLFMIMIAVMLVGVLTAVVMNSGGTETAGIDDETLVIRTSEVQRSVAEIERGVGFIMQNGYSESDLRFAHPDAPADYSDFASDADGDLGDQVFHSSGGGANYPKVPAGVNDGSPWEFYGGTHAPGAGSERAELMAVLPNVTQQFCEYVNDVNGQPPAPQDNGAGGCVYLEDAGRFDDGQQFYGSANTFDETSFTQDESDAAQTALQACVQCTDSSRHFYHVLMVR